MCQPTQFSPRDELDLLPGVWQDRAPQACQLEKSPGRQLTGQSLYAPVPLLWLTPAGTKLWPATAQACVAVRHCAPSRSWRADLVDKLCSRGRRGCFRQLLLLAPGTSNVGGIAA